MLWSGSRALRTGRHGGLGQPVVRPLFAVALLAVALVAAACGSTTAPQSSIAVPSQTFDTNNPNTKIWPTDVINATIALAALDNEIKKASTDLNKAADTSDTALLLGAAEGIVALVTPLQPDAAKMAGFEETKAAGEAYVKALGAIRTSGEALVKSLRAGDGPGVTTNAQALAQAMALYGEARPLIVDLANKAIEMQKHLLR
jgi:hypothetical protein